MAPGEAVAVTVRVWGAGWTASTTEALPLTGSAPPQLAVAVSVTDFALFVVLAGAV
jgi:hypothetical protein